MASEEIIEKARRAVRHERAIVAAAAFGVPFGAASECATQIALGVLAAVDGDFKAVAIEQAANDMTLPEPDGSGRTYLDSPYEDGYWEADGKADEWLRARAKQLRGDAHLFDSRYRQEC